MLTELRYECHNPENTVLLQELELLDVDVPVALESLVSLDFPLCPAKTHMDHNSIVV